MEKKRHLRAGGNAGSGGRAAGTAGILALPDDVMVQIFRHVQGKSLLVVMPSVSVLGQPGPDYSWTAVRGQRRMGHGSIRVPAAAGLEPKEERASRLRMMSEKMID